MDGLTPAQTIQLVSTGGALACLVYFVRMLRGRELYWRYQIEERDQRIMELKAELLAARSDHRTEKGRI